MILCGYNVNKVLFLQTYTGAPGDCYWMGMELINASVATNTSTNWGNYYRNGTVVTSTHFAWDLGQPLTITGYNRVAYCKTANKLYSRPPGDSYSSLCEYGRHSIDLVALLVPEEEFY